ncbi:MAG: HAMP domain-containing histidine kinase [Alphaproteobacteria bacterium]|nr:HAMP domain-containing histidine kinase [Alphaproteobacteria bacterium]
MAARTRVRRISTPITLTVVGVLLSIALLVGWTVLIAQNLDASDRLAATNTWLLFAGPASFVTIIVVLVIFCIRLVRDILQDRRQSRFIDSVTHELRSPLASLRLCLQTLERRELTASQRAELQQMMLEDVDRLSAFIDDILEANRIEHGGEGVAWREVDLHELVERVGPRVCARYKTSADVIRNEVPPGLSLRTDDTALETVVKNLLDNAVKYSDPPAQVTIRARMDSRRVHVEVEDRGIGIPRTHLKRVFDRFYRVPSVGVRKRQGTGLGLYVVASLVRTLGGQLTAHSPGKDQGTTMRFSLPIEPRGETPRTVLEGEHDDQGTALETG